MEDILRPLAMGIAAPLVASSLALMLIWRGAREPSPARVFLTACCLPAFFALGWLLAFDLPELPPRFGMDWILPISLAGAIPGLIAAPSHGRPAMNATAWLVRTLVLLAGLWFMARNRMATAPGETWAAIIGYVVAGLAGAWSLERAGRDDSPLSLWLVVGAACLASAVAGLSGNIQPAIAPAIFCAVVGPAILVRPFAPALRLDASLSFGSTFLVANWFVTWPIGFTPWVSNALLAVSFALVGAPLPSRLSGRARTALRIVLVAIPGLLGAAWAYLSSQRDPY